MNSAMASYLPSKEIKLWSVVKPAVWITEVPCELEINDKEQGVQHDNKYIREIPTGFQNEEKEIININIRLLPRSCDLQQCYQAGP